MNSSDVQAFCACLRVPQVSEPGHMPGQRCRGVKHAIESSCLCRGRHGRGSLRTATCDRRSPPERSRSGDPVPRDRKQCGAGSSPPRTPLAPSALAAPPPLLSPAGLQPLFPRSPELRLPLRLGHAQPLPLREEPRLLTNARDRASGRRASGARKPEHRNTTAAATAAAVFISFEARDRAHYCTITRVPSEPIASPPTRSPQLWPR